VLVAVCIAAALAPAFAAKHEIRDLVHLTGLQVASHVGMIAGGRERAGSEGLTTNWSQQASQAGAAAATDAQQPYDTQAQHTLAQA